MHDRGREAVLLMTTVAATLLLKVVTSKLNDLVLIRASCLALHRFPPKVQSALPFGRPRSLHLMALARKLHAAANPNEGRASVDNFISGVAAEGRSDK